MLLIKSKKLNYGINFPTDLKEITPDVLSNLTANVNLPEYHCIVALCFKTKLFSFVAGIRNNKAHDVGVTPLLAKMSNKDLNKMNINIGDKVIIDRSSLERGVHLPIPTLISTSAAYAYLEKDPNISRAIMTGDINSVLIDPNMNKNSAEENSPYIYVVNFKIVPVNNIYGSITTDSSVSDPFKYIDAN